MKAYVLNIRVFGSFVKKLWNRKRIHFFFAANGIIKFCFEEHGPVNLVTHQQDLKDLFPDLDIDAL